MANVTRNLRDATMTLKDGAAATLAVTLDSGDLAFEETQNVNVILDRGTLDHPRLGNQVPVALSFSTMYVELYGASVTVYEFLKKLNNASAYTSTRTGEDVWCIDIDFLIAAVGTIGAETIAFSDFYFNTIAFAEGEEFDLLSVTGQAFQTAPGIS